MNPKQFFGELQRRNVYRVLAAYCVGGWLLIQIATQVFPFFEVRIGSFGWSSFLFVIGCRGVPARLGLRVHTRGVKTNELRSMRRNRSPQTQGTVA